MQTRDLGFWARLSRAKPARSPIGSSKEPVYYLSNEKTEPQNDLDIPDRHTSIRQMLIAALSCDLTRVASVMLAPSRSPIAMSWIGIQEAHHLLSHNQDLPRLIDINKFYAGEIAKIIADLKAIPEGAGTDVRQYASRVVQRAWSRLEPHP